jgi:PAS domain-containing protein
MLIDHFLKGLISVKPTATVDECMGLMIRMRTPVLDVIDDNHTYWGTVSIYDVMNLQPEAPVFKQGLIKDTLATIEPDTPSSALLRLALANPDGYFTVIGSDKTYRGLVFAGDVLKWHLERKNEECSFSNASLKTLGYGYCIASETEILYASESFYEILQIARDKAPLLQELPGKEYIRRSLKSGSCFTDLEVSHKNSILLMSVSPYVLQNQKSPPNIVMIIFGDTSRIRHYVVLQTIFGSMREGVNIVDEYGIVNYCNPSSAHYVNATPDTLIGASITKYYSKAILLKVIKTHESYFDERLAFDGRVFIVNAVPLFVSGVFKGGIATFREITDIIQLTNRLASMEEQINSMQIELNMNKYSDVFQALVGCDGSLKATIEKAQRCIAALGGPRHCIITGETGTGKTTLAKSMFYFAKKIEVLQPSAPFIEVNCAQFTNPDIAAMEIFGSEKGAYTGATDRMGLIELANGGILFLDEAHALGPYQTMLLKVIEQGILRRIGGRTDKDRKSVV